jgi:hypothetical protein
MTNFDDLRDDLEPGTEDELLVLADRLRRTRPVPRAAFRGHLARHLETLRKPGLSMVRVRLLIASYTVAGTVLLGLGTLGAARLGPLG